MGLRYCERGSSYGAELNYTADTQFNRGSDEGRLVEVDVLKRETLKK
jgi:hypothetical protein